MLEPLGHELFPGPLTGHKTLYEVHEGLHQRFITGYTEPYGYERTVAGAINFSRFTDVLLAEIGKDIPKEIGLFARTSADILREDMIHSKQISPFVRTQHGLFGSSDFIDDANGYLFGWMSAMSYLHTLDLGPAVASEIDARSLPDYVPLVDVQHRRVRADIGAQLLKIGYMSWGLPSHVRGDIIKPKLSAVRIGMASMLLAAAEKTG